MSKEGYRIDGFTDRESYFPPNTPIEQINDTLYTDHCFLDATNAIESHKTHSPAQCIGKQENSLEPPF